MSKTDFIHYPGNLFVVAAPSGAGKSSLVKALLELDAGLALSISHTTRAPRGQEAHGREYYFVDDAAFDSMVEQGDFLEWAQVHDRRYGTSTAAIEQRIAAGQDIVLELDFQGALQVRSLFSQAVLIFVLPPSLQELEARLIRRAEDSPEVIAKRLHNAGLEMAHAPEFDFVIINALFDKAVFDLKSIVQAQRLRFQSQQRAQADVFMALGLTQGPASK